MLSQSAQHQTLTVLSFFPSIFGRQYEANKLLGLETMTRTYLYLQTHSCIMNVRFNSPLCRHAIGGIGEKSRAFYHFSES